MLIAGTCMKDRALGSKVKQVFSTVLLRRRSSPTTRPSYELDQLSALSCSAHLSFQSSRTYLREMAPQRTHQSRRKTSVVDLTDDDVTELMNDFVDLTVEEENDAIIDLTTNIEDLEAATPPPENRQHPIPEGSDSIPSHSLKGWTFKPGDGVELKDDNYVHYEGMSPDCFRIIYILRDRQTNKVSYKGYRLACTNQTAKIRNFLPRREKTLSMTNEYCIMAPSISDLESGNLEQCLSTLR